MPPPNLPALPLGFPVTKSRIGRTIQSPSWSGKRTAVSVMSYPLYKYEVLLEVLHADSPNDFQALMGFYNQLGGPYENFYYVDPYDFTVTNQIIGTGDGVNTDFQLSRTLGGFTEPVQSPALITSVSVNGVPTGAYSVVGNGVIRFSVAPPATQIVRWTGTYVWLCYFIEDQLDFSQFDGFRYEVKKLTFQTEKL